MQQAPTPQGTPAAGPPPGPPSEAEVLVWAEGAAGRIRLNRPAALNSLTPEMVRLIGAGIDRHLADPSVRVLVLDGAGSRGLCAGGDIKLLWSVGRSQPEIAIRFWAEEYFLNARIARLDKPWVALMDGICMGGGVGLSAHGRHRIVTERSRIAMPETGIGYFPDVGSTWILSRPEAPLGLWIGLTGAPIGAADAIAAGMADVMVRSESLPALVADLAAGTDPGAAITAHAGDPGPSTLAENAGLLQRCLSAPDMPSILEALAAEDSDFARATLTLLRQRSPSSLVLTLHLIRAGAASPDLEACIDREFSGNILILGQDDFYEGIRAAVIDKDRNPRWSPASLAEVDTQALLAKLAPQPSLFGG